MKLGIENFSNKFINILNFAKNESLKHTKSLGLVENLECSDSPEHIHRFVFTIVDPVVRIFVENIQNRNHNTFS